jgi:hypothetical protein
VRRGRHCDPDISSHARHAHAIPAIRHCRAFFLSLPTGTVPGCLLPAVELRHTRIDWIGVARPWIASQTILNSHQVK